MAEEGSASPVRVEAGEGKDDPVGLTPGFTKWLIPSATALFAVVGYIVQTAHEDVLGVGSLAHSTSTYVQAAALFFRDIVSLPIDVMLGGGGAALARQSPMLAFTLTMLALLVVTTYVPRLPAWLVRWAAPFVICVLLAVKFVNFDAPLTLVHDLVLGSDTVQVRVVEPTDPIESPPGQKGWLFSYEAGQANRLAYAIVCSHLGDGARSNQRALAGKARDLGSNDCDPDRAAQSAGSARATFCVLLLMQLVITWAAIMIIRSPQQPSHRRHLIAVFALIYGLTIPYAYGKLLRSTSFEIGKIALSHSLGMADGVESADMADRVRGLVVGQDGSGTRVLTTIPDQPCKGRSDMSSRRIVMLSLSPSQVISVGQIESRDIFEWSFASATRCP